MTVHGDFSRSVADGFAGVLYQQGRVFLDADGTAQTLISNAWQDTAARDTFGGGIAAASQDDPDAFKVISATQTGTGSKVQLLPGHIWADGMLIRQPTGIGRLAQYLGTPVPAAPVAGDRDVVVLEVWREAISGFQITGLLEPALGGPDTTERLNTSWDLRLVRLAPGEDCTSIADQLREPVDKGHLTASLQPTTVVPGDCPVVEGGGYAGFEHNLYRIEIADDAGARQFKWSQFNGGLVGRATFVANQNRALVRANFQAIASCGLDSIYLEALIYDESLGHWVVAYGAENVTFDVDSLVLPAPVVNAAITTPASVFIRLWNGIRLVADFPKGAAVPTELQDGVRLEFDPEAAFSYRVGDYWTFTVRAGEIETASPMVDDLPPEGIVQHRVPLAELTWDGSPDAVVADDCRHVVPPLGTEGCCVYRVGDGIHSHGDFRTIQQAVDALPLRGGEICVLEGVYRENIVIAARVGVHICGCGDRSRVVSPDTGRPVFHVIDSRSVTICHLLIAADRGGPGLLLEDLTAEKAQRAAMDIGASGSLRFIELIELDISASRRSAIEAHGAMDTVIRGCTIGMLDERTNWPGIFFEGLDSLIERNVVRVRQLRIDDRRGPVAWQTAVTPSEGIPLPAEAGLGGVQLGGLSERIRVQENVIQGGIGNGITLGSVRLQDRRGRFLPTRFGWVINIDDPCQPCKPGDIGVPDPGPDDPERPVSAGPLRDIYLERNRVLDMGLCGVGVVGFFNLKVAPELVTVARLTIVGNEIRRCLRRSLAPVRNAMAALVGYGGVSVADVERLVLRDNVIEDNGPDFLEPVCGVFVLHGEGVDIAHNRIVNNGADTGEPSSRARPGLRGGINIVLALPAPAPASQRDDVLRLSGEETPALRISDNVVSAPLGQALVANLAGPAQIHGNYFTSQGVAGRADNSAIFGATVELRNIGRSREEVARLNFVGMVGYAKTQQMFVAPGGPATAAAVRSLAVGAAQSLSYFGRVLAAGTTMFNDNQCLLDIAEGRRVLTPVDGAASPVNQVAKLKPVAAAGAVGVFLSRPRATSVLIASLDDVSFQDNQCLTDIEAGVLLAQALVAGGTVRAMGNRLKEGNENAMLSAITLGAINTTTENQCTHCVAALPPSGVSALTIDDRNLIVTPSAFACAEWSYLMYRAIVTGGR